VGEKIGKDHLTYAQGAAAEITAMVTIGAADVYGLPVSTTHVLSSGVAGTMAGHTALVPTLSVLASLVGFAATDGGRFADARPTSEALLERALDAVRAAHAAGVRIATGSDFGGGSVRPGHLAWEVELLVRAGLAPHEALGSATFVGGELLGLPDAGRLRVGGPADCALVHGDPLSDPAALWRVWLVVHDGVVV